MKSDADLELTEENLPQKKLHFEWTPGVFLRPRRTLAEIIRQDTAVWLTPLLILTVFGVISVLITGPVRSQAALQNMVQPNPEMQQYLSPEQLEQMQSGLSVSSGPLFIYGFPLISSLASIWLGWLLMGGLLHLGLTMTGSRSSNRVALNLTAWAGLPLAIRMIVQTAAVLIAGKEIAAPGLSGFVAVETGRSAAFFSALLSRVDLYFVWQVVLIFIGVVLMDGFRRKKSLAAAGVVILLVLVLFALPRFLGSMLGSLTSGGGGMFFF